MSKNCDRKFLKHSAILFNDFYHEFIFLLLYKYVFLHFLKNCDLFSTISHLVWEKEFVCKISRELLIFYLCLVYHLRSNMWNKMYFWFVPCSTNCKNNLNIDFFSVLERDKVRKKLPKSLIRNRLLSWRNLPLRYL